MHFSVLFLCYCQLRWVEPDLMGPYLLSENLTFVLDVCVMVTWTVASHGVCHPGGCQVCWLPLGHVLASVFSSAFPLSLWLISSFLLS